MIIWFGSIGCLLVNTAKIRGLPAPALPGQEHHDILDAKFVLDPEFGRRICPNE